MPSGPQGSLGQVCHPLAGWFRLCWADLVVVVALALLVLLFFVLATTPVIFRLRKMFKAKRKNSEPILSSSSPSQSHATLRRTQTHQPKPLGMSAEHHEKDPYLFMSSSLDNSLLLKSGVVPHTQRPEPTLKARDAMSTLSVPKSCKTLTPDRGHAERRAYDRSRFLEAPRPVYSYHGREKDPYDAV